MKQILFAAIAALAITGCSQNEDIERAADKAEINFNTAVSKTTKAVTTTNADFNTFVVYAYAHGTDNFGTNSLTAIMTKAGFTKNTTWAADEGKTFYWPATDKVSFFAYSLKTPNDVTLAQSEKDAPNLTYTVKTTAADQEDLVVAEVLNKQKETDKSTPAVSLTFKHALAKIGFKVRGEGEGVKYDIDKIVVKAKNKGVYTYKGSTATPDVTELGTWANGSDAAETGYEIATTSTTFTGSDTTPAPTDDTHLKDFSGDADKTLMLIPQDLSGVSIEVFYKATLNNIELCDCTTNPQKITFTAPDAKWAAGQYVVYTLVLKGGEKMAIEGNLSDDWNTSTDGGEI